MNIMATEAINGLGLTQYDGPPARDKNGNIIPNSPGQGCGCLIFTVPFLLVVGLVWYAIKNWF